MEWLWSESDVSRGKIWSMDVEVPGASLMFKYLRLTITLDSGNYYSRIAIGGVCESIYVDSGVHGSFDEAQDFLAETLRNIVLQMGESAVAWRKTFGAKVYSVSEVAELLGVPRNTVLHWIRVGTLDAFRFGHKWMIPQAELARRIGH